MTDQMATAAQAAIAAKVVSESLAWAIRMDTMLHGQTPLTARFFVLPVITVRLKPDEEGGTRMRTSLTVTGAMLAFVLVCTLIAFPAAQTPAAPATPTLSESALREYSGVYQWAPNAFVYLQLWNEFVGFDKPGQLFSFDESGEVRMLSPTDRDRFFTGRSVAVAEPRESDIEFQRDSSGRIRSLTWRREGTAPRTARRVEIERHEEVRFTNGDIQLTGTLVSPATGGRHPAIVLVHGSGAENREYMLPWARFLIRHGIAVLGYDKRGVGGSSGDWNTASFDDLAGDVVAALEYLKTRRDIEPRRIGLLGISQAGWIMPLAAVRAKDLAFLISISGAGVPAAETTIDQARNEMVAGGTPPQVVEQIVGLMNLQYAFARTGEGFAEYADTLAKLTALARAAGVQWPPPDLFPASPDHAYFQFIRRLYFYDPAPTLRQLQLPILAIWGELDNNIMAEKNRSAWETALKAGGNRDYTLRILPKANHAQFEAKIGSNAETNSLQRIVPEYFTLVQDWLAKRIRG